MSHWLPLTEYSSKYRVSLSTLRRRIKAEDIQFRFSDGKYLIIDEPISITTSSAFPLPPQSPSQSQAEKMFADASRRPSPSDAKSEVYVSDLVKRETMANEERENIDRSQGYRSSSSPISMPKILQKDTNTDDTILSAANKLLAELKKAYSQILQEKEEQILNLKEEVSDLKTLVKVLESDNNRYKHRSY
jgi:hypothetical protein